jgi:hypothetical protein
MLLLFMAVYAVAVVVFVNGFAGPFVVVVAVAIVAVMAIVLMLFWC